MKGWRRESQREWWPGTPYVKLTGFRSSAGAPAFQTPGLTPEATTEDSAYPYHITLPNFQAARLANELQAAMGYQTTFRLTRYSWSMTGTCYEVDLLAGSLGPMLQQLIAAGFHPPQGVYHISM